ncbi:DNA translocase FtsK 4TM domain-containing protein [Herbaspirillum sp. WKF16]|uniref:DNA translocase FtsK n=1 Tax=Herbaspirillum sp. WKF16 TaxID=3028312 RepID=UPI0023A9DFCA|nr:DNA translocase FtsK 4TM domain-containing protein [Herbaspirillum sp. WKF16]WDZ97379.1 DNA translocase FtsK 4TM domain-containing protein [Herbaspirillum sp. WKF16]
MIFVKWFGWSVLWLIPLALRAVISALARRSPLGGRGAIRVWVGSLLLLCASAALESLVRAQVDTGDDGERGDLFGFALMDALAGKLNKGIAALIMLALAALGLKWLLGAIFSRAAKAGPDEHHPELDLGPRRGSIESERMRMAGNGKRFGGNERLSATPRAPRTPAAARAQSMSNASPTHASTPFGPKKPNRFSSPSERIHDAQAREDWQVPLSSLNRSAGAQGGKWPALRQGAADARARPESEWAAFETLRPTDAMLARAAASTAISAASAAANASLSRASAPGPAQQHIPPSIARAAQGEPASAPSPTPTRSIRISSVGRAARQAPEAGAPAERADVVPTRLMRSLQEASGQTPAAPLAPPAAAPVAPAPIDPLPQLPPEIQSAPAQAEFAGPRMEEGAPEPAGTPAAQDTVDALPPAPMTPPAAIVPPPAPSYAAPWFDMLDDPEPEPEVATPERLFEEVLPPAGQQPFSVRAAETQPQPQPPAAVIHDDGEFEPHVDIPLPSLELLDEIADAAIEVDAAQLEETGRLIEQRLKEFKVPVTVLGAEAGPVITRFEVEPAQGVRGAQVVNLMKDLSRALGLTSIRVVETIPGKTCMGLELPNARRQMIKLSEIVRSEPYRKSSSLLTIAMGKDITGKPVVTDLARAPHMLVAGTTGSGKSVAINAMILSLLYKATPDEVRLIMIDPKMLELSIYEGIPHLLAPVVTDMREAAHALNWAVDEMERRYKKMSKLGVRNLAGYNQKIDDAHARGEKIPNPFSLTPDAPEPLDKLPTIVIVIDELADLMMVVGKKVEELIARLAQKARAAGIHLILATQRPSVDVITGLIKANIPTRVAFQVSSKIDSRTVLDQMGAESLLGHGDMLFLPPGSGYPQRVHGAFVSDDEVHRVVEYLKSFGEPRYIEEILAPPMVEDAAQGDMFGSDMPDPESDPLYDEAVAFVLKSRRASISSVQRQFRIGYNRAARLVEQMETAGVLSAMSRNGSRDILVPPSGGEE